MAQGRIATIAFLLGFAMMALELTAVRLLAPHFGDSAYVWTNVIGVMLVALAVGAWVGGAWAARPNAHAVLTWALVASALSAALAPLLASSFGGWLVPQDLPLDAAMAALVRGSLVATLVLFAPPVLLLGCAGPMLVATLVGGGVRVGRASGLVNACSTLGSLAGTFAATHLLVPSIGSRATVWLCAALVAVCAVLVRRRAAPIAAALVPAVLALLPPAAIRPPEPGVTLVAEVESAMQFLQVVQDERDGTRTTVLKINEGLDSFHSMARTGTAWTGAYYDWHVTAAIFTRDGTVPDGRDLRVLSLGAAAGTFARLFDAAFPGCVVDGVELDPAVVRLGDLYFGGRGAAGQDFAGLDARVFVERATGESFDVVLVDTYARQIYLPAHVASVEFFTAAARCLRHGGVVTVNSGGWSFDDPVVRALGATMARVFGEAWGLAVPWSRNYVLAARKGKPLRPDCLRDVQTQHTELAAVVARAADPAAWRRFVPGEHVLRDDQPLLDTLQHRALARARAGHTDALTAATGSRDPAEIGTVAHALRSAGRPEAVLDVLRSAANMTPYLRLLAGDARWGLHDLAGARAEFAAGLALGPEAEVREALAARLRDIGGLLAGLRRAESVAVRNGWLAAVSGLMFLLAGAWLARRALGPRLHGGAT